MDHNKYDHESPHASFPIIAVAIIGIFATIFILVFYYIFVIKCCLNWHRIDILRRFSLSRSRSNNHNYHQHHSSASSELPKGLDESVIRLIPIFKFQKKQNDSEHECAVCLAEFQDNEKLRMIPNCAHVFHIDCIDVWLQNNPNCPLCRNSISISIPSHYPVPEDATNIDMSPTDLSEDNDYVVIELCSNAGERRNVTREDDVTFLLPPTPVPKKTGKNVRKKYGHVLSMGDECIDVNTRRKDDDQFDIQPIRRSFSMDSASDRQLLLAVQEIVQRNTMNDHVDVSEVNDGSSSSNRLKRGFFSFGHARSAILPLHLSS